MPGAALPTAFALWVKFKSDDKERVSISHSPIIPRSPWRPPLPRSRPHAPPKGQCYRPGTRRQQCRKGPASWSILCCIPLSVSNAIRPEEPLPTTTAGLLTELANRAQSVKALLDEGNLGGLWYPALRAKDVAVALEENHVSDIAEAQRSKMASAVKRLTLAAWQIDAAGDLGNKERLLPLYRDFAVGDR